MLTYYQHFSNVQIATWIKYILLPKPADTTRLWEEDILLKYFHFFKRVLVGDFPGSPVVKNLHAHVGTWAPSLVHKDSTGFAAAKPVYNNYSAHTLGPQSHNYRAHEPRSHTPQQKRPAQWEACTLQSLHTATRQSPHTAAETQHSQK